MSLRLFQAVLASNHTKSSTPFAQLLMAYHACSRCGRMYCSVARLALEMNVDPRNAKTLLKKLRDEKYLEPTGETTPDGVIVYRLRGVMESSPDDISRDDETITGGVMKSCRFCRREVMESSPNKLSSDRRSINDGRARARTQTPSPKTGGQDGTEARTRIAEDDEWRCRYDARYGGGAAHA
jgi:hypothetical protein